MEELFLPVLSHFRNGNVWTASVGALRYKVTPGGEELTAEIWPDPFCYELSRVEATETFPLTGEGMEARRAWVLARAAEMNARPAPTLAETLAARDRAAAGKAEQT